MLGLGIIFSILCVVLVIAVVRYAMVLEKKAKDEMVTPSPVYVGNGGASLVLKDIVKVYGEGDTAVHALKGVSINFRRSEFVSILGQSGC